MTTRSVHIRIARALAVIVAGSSVGVAGTFAFAAARPAQPAPEQHAPELAAVAEWARTQHLTGLSPASLAAPDPAVNLEARRAAEMAAIAEWAIGEGLSGLSPASLRPAGK